VVLAAFKVVLARYCGVEDVVVGSPVANRPRRELEGLVGFFVNTLVLRTDVSGDPSFRELVGRVREGALGAYTHQDLPFEYLVEHLRPERDLSRHPLVQVMLQIVNTPFEQVPWPDAEVELFEAGEVSTRVDLEAHLVENEDGSLAGPVVYSRALFDESTVERFVRHLGTALAGLLADPDRPISDLTLLDEDESDRLHAARTAAEVPVDVRPLPRLLAEQAARTPELIAVEYRDETVGYAELISRANQLAHHLRSLGVGPDSLVGLCLRRGIDMFVGLVGILQAGAAYVPINPDHPADRVRRIVDNARMATAVTEPSAGRLFPEQVTTVFPAELADDLRALPTSTPDSGVTPDHLAYVVYTSGSTGEPKGIAMSGRCVVNMLEWQKVAVPGGPGTRTAQFTELTFDVSVQEVLSALLYGETLVVPDADTRRDPAAFVRWLADRAINQVFVPNVMVRAMSAQARRQGADLGSLRHISQAGEPLALDEDLRALFDRCPELRMHNHYGSTEVQVVTAYTLPEDTSVWPRKAPVGTATWNHHIYVVDRQRRLVPVGVPGEICVAGPGLARGYVGQPGLTADRFVADPFGEPGSRMYRTGDLGRWLTGGNLEYLGRIDDQVKIRGFRVEPGEVESVLRRHPSVAQAAVVAREDRPGHRRLVAYLIPHDDTHPDHGSLRAHLADALPDYLVPSAFVTLAAFPLTSTGKIDRRALPAPEHGPTAGGVHAAPDSPEQHAVCDAFAEVFGVERVGVDDDFFELGGHSLLATQVAARIEAATGAAVPLVDLFRLRTPRSLATVLRAAGAANAPARPRLVPAGRDVDAPLSFAQEGYWAVARAHPDSHLWNVPFVMRARGPLDLDALGSSLSSLIGRHEALRTTIAVDGAEPAQRIRPAEPVVLTPERVPGATPDERLRTARELIADEASRPFDLVHGPILRIKVLSLDPQDHVIALTTHHMATDAWSQDVLWHEISTAYAAALTGDEPLLPELPVQYADFAHWQRAWLAGDTLREQWDYWDRRLEGCPTPAALPTDRPRVDTPDPDGGSVSLALAPELVRAARARGAEADATLFITLLAAFAVVLADETGQQDVVVGSPVAGRTRTELENLVGGFANMLVLRTDVSGDPTFREVLARTRETATGAFARQEMPFHLLAERFGDDRHGLVQVMFQLVNTPHGQPSLAGTRLESFDHGRVSVRMDLEVTLMENGDDVTAHALFRRSLFEQATVERLLRRLTTVAQTLLADPDRRLSTALPDAVGGTR
ncbi:amino acid adenylation domain-containing protein, partial [Kitasatospora sp. NPDC050463]|uniref:amino acid adenylation domain-containing protein n=1 Tax=Kitasatospora sp. NPDC050463 TaxID=3155786 RepID=UPI0033F05A1C